MEEFMKKIVFIGGGSAKFVREVVVDLFGYPELQDAEIVLMDIDSERADRSRRLVDKMIADRVLPAKVWSTTDRRKALAGADYVIVTIMVGGLEAYKADIDIPAKYGVFQAVSDTVGPGAVMRVIRTAPVLAGIAQELKELAPHAWLLNYANPMAMNVWTINASGWTRAVGLCHSIQHLYRAIGHWLSIHYQEIKYTAGGINHLDFYLTVTHNGRDLYPDLLTAAPRILAESPCERSRFELLEYLGHFPAEGPQHQTEYYPWFRKDQKTIDYYRAETYWGYALDSANYRERVVEIDQQIAGARPITYDRSLEYGASIIHALETGDAESFYGNVPNNGLIENLPAQAMVEVPCVADRNGIIAGRVGRIPAQLAAVMQPHISVHEMAVIGTLTKNKRMIRQAIQGDPLTGAILTLPRIREMVDELLMYNRSYMQDWN